MGRYAFRRSDVKLQAKRPSRGEVWLVDLEPVEGHEQGGRRPCLVISDDLLNHGPSGLVIVVPLTTKWKTNSMRVTIDPPDGGVKHLSFTLPEMIRSVSVNRLHGRWGTVSDGKLVEVEHVLRALLRI